MKVSHNSFDGFVPHINQNNDWEIRDNLNEFNQKTRGDQLFSGPVWERKPTDRLCIILFLLLNACLAFSVVFGK